MTTEDFEDLTGYLESRGWTECQQFEGGRRWIKSFTVFGTTNVNTFSIQIAINANPEHDLPLDEWLQDLTQRIQPEYHWAIAPIIERFGNPAPSDTINQPQETP
jgi:hypothetical protein